MEHAHPLVMPMTPLEQVRITELCRLIQEEKNVEKATALARELNDLLELVRRGRKNISTESVT
jgi:hypothetical protein